MKAVLRRFAREEDGAVTVDWVVLTAGLVTLALGITLLMQDVLPSHLGNLLADASTRVMP